MSDQSTTVLLGYLERACRGDVAARQRLLELTRDRLMRHARLFLHGRYARLEPFAQTDDVVQQLYLKILQNQDRFWVNARGEDSAVPVSRRDVGEFDPFAVLVPVLAAGGVHQNSAHGLGGGEEVPAVLPAGFVGRPISRRSASWTSAVGWGVGSGDSAAMRTTAGLRNSS